MQDRNKVAITEWHTYEDICWYDEEEIDIAQVIICSMTKKPRTTHLAGKTSVLTHTSIRPIHQWADLFMNEALRMLNQSIALMANPFINLTFR